MRYVVVPGYTDDERSAHLLGEFIGDMENVEMVELLPYHELGAHKWALCGDEYKLKGVHPPPKRNHFENQRNIRELRKKHHLLKQKKAV